ncbi:hypothetical protein F383_28434 [Gossypium arboreum]|uniref:Uncharacterized protein n=1 Tax=Gossypium arboreum TaxID=29729 RepID=A0A0B0MPB4_GOSAR|nr:hypothetical protein F383_28434 [Gossypium arboreum]
MYRARLGCYIMRIVYAFWLTSKALFLY